VRRESRRRGANLAVVTNGRPPSSLFGNLWPLHEPRMAYGALLYAATSVGVVARLRAGRAASPGRRGARGPRRRKIFRKPGASSNYVTFLECPAIIMTLRRGAPGRAAYRGAAEERFSRKKHDPALPVRAIRCASSTPGLFSGSRVRCVLRKPLLKFERILATSLRLLPEFLRFFREGYLHGYLKSCDQKPARAPVRITSRADTVLRAPSVSCRERLLLLGILRSGDSDGGWHR